MIVFIPKGYQPLAGDKRSAISGIEHTEHIRPRRGRSRRAN